MCPNPTGWVFSTCWSYWLRKEEAKRSFAGLCQWLMARSTPPTSHWTKLFSLSTENGSKIWWRFTEPFSIETFPADGSWYCVYTYLLIFSAWVVRNVKNSSVWAVPLVCNPFTEDPTKPLTHFLDFTALASLSTCNSESRNTVNKKEAVNKLTIVIT